MRTVFMTAEQARDGALNNQIVYNEIRDIEKMIIDAVEKGNYQLSVNSTRMTSPVPTKETPYGTGENYFRVWKCLDCGIDTSYDKEALRLQMKQVITHFRDLGYFFERRITSDDAKTFYWKVEW